MRGVLRALYNADPRPFLPEYVSYYACFGLKRLVRSYTGNCLRVRRSSDNSESDIGFDGNHKLDWGALFTFIGASTSAFVVTMYDQSGNTRNVTQGTAGLQPKLDLTLRVVTHEDALDGTRRVLNLGSLTLAQPYTVFGNEYRNASVASSTTWQTRTSNNNIGVRYENAPGAGNNNRRATSDNVTVISTATAPDAMTNMMMSVYNGASSVVYTPPAITTGGTGANDLTNLGISQITSNALRTYHKWDVYGVVASDPGPQFYTDMKRWQVRHSDLRKWH